jgi:hypothetical protein
MKKVLVACTVVIVVAIMAAVITYLDFTSIEPYKRHADAVGSIARSAEPAVQALLPKAFKSWSPTELKKHATPDLIDRIDQNPVGFEKRWRTFAALGELQAVRRVKVRTYEIEASAKLGTEHFVHYDIDAAFARSTAVLSVQMRWTRGHWKLNAVQLGSGMDRHHITNLNLRR